MQYEHLNDSLSDVTSDGLAQAARRAEADWIREKAAEEQNANVGAGRLELPTPTAGPTEEFQRGKMLLLEMIDEAQHAGKSTAELWFIKNAYDMEHLRLTARVAELEQENRRHAFRWDFLNDWFSDGDPIVFLQDIPEREHAHKRTWTTEWEKQPIEVINVFHEDQDHPEDSCFERLEDAVDACLKDQGTPNV